VLQKYRLIELSCMCVLSFESVDLFLFESTPTLVVFISIPSTIST
jgi:hypothetical protein